MKIEVKDLTPYLPYGLKMYHKGVADALTKAKQKYNPTTLKMLSRDGSFWVGKESDSRSINQDIHKPILRPLSDIIKEIEVSGEKFVPLGSLLVQKYPKWFQEHQGSKKYTNITLDFSGRFATAFLTFQATHEVQIDSTYVENTPYLIFKKLLEWHFDVFGLIEKGLAIDINTLNDKL